MIRLRVKAKRGALNGRRAISLRRDVLARAVAAGAEDLRETARELLGRSSPTRHSAPGEPPRTQTGRLRDSIFVRLRDGGLTAEVGTDLDYGRHLEFGTQRMAARPWLHPAFEAAKGRIEARIRAALRGTR